MASDYVSREGVHTGYIFETYNSDYVQLSGYSLGELSFTGSADGSNTITTVSNSDVVDVSYGIGVRDEMDSLYQQAYEAVRDNPDAVITINTNEGTINISHNSVTIDREEAVAGDGPRVEPVYRDWGRSWVGEDIEYVRANGHRETNGDGRPVWKPTIVEQRKKPKNFLIAFVDNG